MKILRVSLCNLASLAGPHTVDFSLDPLRTAGLFSISGPTGSGKSTLLDAICLALYDETPRLCVAPSKVKLADVTDEMTLRDSRNLLTRGAVEGYAEVAFVGVDGATYTARWSVRRARLRADRPLQSAEVQLFHGNILPGTEGSHVCGKKWSEVQPAIVEKVGLTYKQFTRAVLLAQNEFATFLRADDAERAGILQALTGTERFEQISKAVYARNRQEEEAVQAIESRLAGSAPMSLDDRAAAEAACDQAELAVQRAGEQVKAREAHVAWFKRGAELTKDLRGAEEKLATALAAQHTAGSRREDLAFTERVLRQAHPLHDRELQNRHDLLDAEKRHAETTQKLGNIRQALEQTARAREAAEIANKTKASALEQARDPLKQARDLDSRLVTAAREAARTTQEREAAEAEKTAMTARRTALENEKTTLLRAWEGWQAQLKAKAECVAFSADARAWLDRLDRALAVKSALAKAEQELAAYQKAEQAKREKLDTLRPLLAAAAEKVKDAGEHLRTAEAEAGRFNAEEMLAARRTAEETRDTWRKIEQQWREVALLAREEEETKRQLAQTRLQQQEEAAGLEQLKTREIPGAEATLQNARQAFALAEAALDDAALRLREKLAPDAPCPVCGAQEHPYSTRAPALEASVLRVLRDDAAAKEKHLAALHVQAASLVANAQAREKELLTLARTIEAIEQRLAEGRAMKFTHPATLALQKIPEAERVVAATAQLVEVQAQIEKLAAEEAARLKAERQRERCREARDQAASALSTLEKQSQELLNSHARVHAAMEAAILVHANQAEHWRELQITLAPLLAQMKGANEAWETNAPKFRDALAADFGVVIEAGKRSTEVEGSLRETRAALANVVASLVKAEAIHTSRLQVEKLALAEHAAIAAQRSALFAGRAADEVEADLRNAVRVSEELRDRCAASHTETEKQLATALEAVRATTEATQEKRTALSSSIQALDAWLAEVVAGGRPCDRTMLSGWLARDEHWMQSERQALQALDSAIDDARGQWAVHVRNLDNHLALRPTAEEEAAVMEDLALKRAEQQEVDRRRTDARGALSSDDQRRRESGQLADELEKQRAKALPWQQLNKLIGSADGAVFRAIAQQRSLDLLLGYANAQLELLNARYRLERLKMSLNLVIIDRDMGDERRSVHSLSGGESFLVSLALALALASLTSNRVRIESLFIDEGFGSLDPETLNIAMSALMRLEAQGRKVGVISHVAELTDAIRVQIRVVKGKSGTSRLVVPGAPEVVPAPLPARSATKGAEVQTQEWAERLLTILQRAKAAGNAKVSTRALRDELGCSQLEFNAAREALQGLIHLDGRSLCLAGDPT